MAEFVMQGAYFVVDGRDFACQFSEASLNYQAELQDRTAICDVTRKRVAGLTDVDWSLTGFWASDTASTDNYSSGRPPSGEDFDQIFFNKVGSTNSNYAIGLDKTTGSVSFFGQGINGSYDLGGTIGELLTVNINFQGSGVPSVVRGEVGLSGLSTATSINGPGITLGAVTNETVYACAFVQGSTSGTCDVALVSSTDASDFSGGTTRANFTQFTSTGSEFVSVSGPITDTAWRFEVTQGSSPSFNLLLVLGTK
jgi:hypothetical protein